MQKNLETPLLVAQTGPLNGQKWVLDKETCIGRDASCEIVIPDRQVSRRHVCVSPVANGFVVRDMESKNGTHHNGKRIRIPIVLQDGDVIQVAFAQEFVFISAEATVPLDASDLELQSETRRKLRLQKKSRRIWVGGTEVVPPLSVAQFRLLELLYENEGKVVSRQALTKGIWGDKGALDISNQALDALIRRLRDRLAEIDPSYNYIMTVRGHGLRLENPAA